MSNPQNASSRCIPQLSLVAQPRFRTSEVDNDGTVASPAASLAFFREAKIVLLTEDQEVHLFFRLDENDNAKAQSLLSDLNRANARLT